MSCKRWATWGYWSLVTSQKGWATFLCSTAKGKIRKSSGSKKCTKPESKSEAGSRVGKRFTQTGNMASRGVGAGGDRAGATTREARQQVGVTETEPQIPQESLRLGSQAHRHRQSSRSSRATEKALLFLRCYEASFRFEFFNFLHIVDLLGQCPHLL